MQNQKYKKKRRYSNSISIFSLFFQALTWSEKMSQTPNFANCLNFLTKPLSLHETFSTILFVIVLGFSLKKQKIRERIEQREKVQRVARRENIIHRLSRILLQAFLILIILFYSKRTAPNRTNNLLLTANPLETINSPISYFHSTQFSSFPSLFLPCLTDWKTI